MNYLAIDIKKTRRMILLVCTIIGMSDSLFAQQTTGPEKTSSINVTGKVVSVLDGQAILIEAISDPSFQQENIDDTQVVVDPITDDAGGMGGAGYLVAKGEPNRVFQVTIPDVITLINAETNNTFDVQVNVSHNSSTEQSSSDYVRDNLSEFILNDEGEYYFWLGGIINVADVEEGAYEGSFMLELENI